jgi:hypothetical protein
LRSTRDQFMTVIAATGKPIDLACPAPVADDAKAPL